MNIFYLLVTLDEKLGTLSYTEYSVSSDSSSSVKCYGVHSVWKISSGPLIHVFMAAPNNEMEILFCTLTQNSDWHIFCFGKHWAPHWTFKFVLGCAVWNRNDVITDYNTVLSQMLFLGSSPESFLTGMLPAFTQTHLSEPQTVNEQNTKPLCSFILNHSK